MLTSRGKFKIFWVFVCFGFGWLVVIFSIFKKDLTSQMLSVGNTNIQTLLTFALRELFAYIFNKKQNVWFRVCLFDFRLISKVDINSEWVTDSAILKMCYIPEKLQNSVWREFSIAGPIIREPDIPTSTPVPIVVGPLTLIHTLSLVYSRTQGLTLLLFLERRRKGGDKPVSC